ncbi:MAG TPA: hypothetical protein VJA26_08485 [Gammaproteobacteria bacterium]|nr:hypothetical protein [Gammaproteobacteria bacterium]
MTSQTVFSILSASRREACLAVLLAFAIVPAAQAQTSDRSRSDESIVAQRDFGGTWERFVPPRNPDTPRGTGPAGPMFGGPRPPLKPEFVAAYDAELRKIAEAEARGEPIPTANTHCLPDGMPAMMIALFPMEVLQTRGQVTIIQEAFNQVRRIYIGEEPIPIEDAEPVFWGHSAANWDGDTLVVETVGIKESVRYRNAPHSDQMRIHERMRVLDADHFENQITITDPVYLTGPWTWTWTYQRKPDYKMYEYVCEDNREFADPETGAQRMRFDNRSE